MVPRMVHERAYIIWDIYGGRRTGIAELTLGTGYQLSEQLFCRNNRLTKTTIAHLIICPGNPENPLSHGWNSGILTWQQLEKSPDMLVIHKLTNRYPYVLPTYSVSCSSVNSINGKLEFCDTTSSEKSLKLLKISS